MLVKSVGRIRTNNPYEDTEAVLLEMAAERGNEAQLRTWLRSPGYVPESAMYSIMGDPSRIRLRAP